MSDGLFSKIKNAIGVNDEDEYEEDEMPTVSSAETFKPVSPDPARRYSSVTSYQDRNSSLSQPKADYRESKVVSMQNTTVKKITYDITVIEPKSYDECSKLVKHLKDGKPIIINIEKLDNELSRKIFDFLSGATFALGGSCCKISNMIFLFAPENVRITPLEDDGRSPSSITGGSGPWRR